MSPGPGAGVPARADPGPIRRAVRWAVLLILVWFGGLLLLAALQDHFIWFPQRLVETTPAAAGLAFEEVRIATSDGESIHGWFVPAQAPRATMLFLHGNAGNIGHRIHAIEGLHAVGLATLIIDYRGYGESSGAPSESGVLEDAAAAWTHLTTVRAIPGDRIVLYGESIGSVPAIALAGRILRTGGAPPRAVVLEGAFTSALEMGRRSFPFLPVGWILRDRMDNLSAIRDVTVPTLIAHAEHDEIVPIAMGRRLPEASPAARKVFHVIRGAGHNARSLEADRALREAIAAFLERVEGL